MFGSASLRIFGETITDSQYKTPILACRLCGKKFSIRDISEGAFFASTKGCLECYNSLMQQPYSQSCFGKPSLLYNLKTFAFGHNGKVPECKSFCPDREVCRTFVIGQGYDV
jgi:hypothetical protein